MIPPGIYQVCEGEENPYGVPPVIAISKSDVREILWTRSGHSSRKVRNVGIGIIVTGVFSALVVSPLASINYKTGGFNEKRYYKMAGFSLASLGVSIPIMVATRQKSFSISGYEAKWRF